LSEAKYLVTIFIAFVEPSVYRGFLKTSEKFNINRKRNNPRPHNFGEVEQQFLENQKNANFSAKTAKIGHSERSDESISLNLCNLSNH
jgi:hypothetical protein